MRYSRPNFRSSANTLRLSRWLLSLLGFFLALQLRAEPSFTTELDRERVNAGDTATLKLIFTDLGEVEAPTLPALTNCTIRYQGVSRQLSIVNFTRSSSIIHQYSLQPQNPGTVSIPGLQVEVDGKTYTSQPLTLQVGQGINMESIGFLRLVAPRSEFYVGETFPLEIRFYYREAPARQAPPTLKLDGFIKGRQTVENLPPETLTNVLYSVVRWSLALTAVKAGELTLGPAEFQTLYLFNNPGRRRARGVEALFEPLLGGAEQKQHAFQSDSLTLRVLNPPAAGRPANFNGAVGRFRVEVTASPTNVAAGDPVTVRVQVSGQGNIEGLRLPELPAGSGFQLYPGTNSFTEGDSLGLSGIKTFEAVIVPEVPGVQSLKWPWLTYWDPGAKAYAADQPRPLVLNVRPGANAQAQPVGTVPGPPEPRTPPTSVAATAELALLQELGPLASLAASPVTQPWFWGVLGFPLAVYAALVLAPILRQQRAEDPKRTARQQARRELTKYTNALRERAHQGQGPQFFAALNGALQQQLALTLGGPPGSFTDDVVETRLVPAGLPPEAAERLQDLFNRLAEARFSPTVSAGELPHLRERAEQVLAAVRQLPEAT